MKVAPLLRALRGSSPLETFLIHSGQHYDDNMSGQFFRDLGMPEPDYHLDVRGGSHAEQTGEVMKRLEPVLMERKPRGLVVVGDVNSTMAGALVAKKLGLELVHAEAGLRSNDRTMPEEINRIVTDSISDLLLVTEDSGRRNLLREGVAADRIEMVGNLMIDSLQANLTRAKRSDIRARLAIPERYGVITLHRPANVDCQAKLAEILEALGEIAAETPLYWPVHPRTRALLLSGSNGQGSGIRVSAGVHLLEPLGYLDFLCLQAHSSVVLTDSGGIQEEATVLGVPCLTLRENTERPATIECGTNRLAGTSKTSILRAWADSQQRPKRGAMPPLWDGQAGERCRSAIERHFGVETRTKAVAG
jgi:UDP-N-acetylglucosamine 2-epimerase (non-hydrolysing)